jgi:hypothetical protein
MMFRTLLLQGILTVAVVPAVAQVVTPTELNDPKLQRLQQREFRTLVDIGGEIQRHKFPYPFYLSKVLDVDLAKMKDIDQRSIRFDSYKGETVLEITGNYYASYSADTMDAEKRLKTTFEDVILPLLKIEVPHFPDDSEFASFAFEVSHHVREKIAGIRQERPENATVIIPVVSAQKLVDAKTDEQRQSAVLDARTYLNGQPYVLWLQEGQPPEDWQDRYRPPAKNKQSPETVAAGGQSPAPSSGVSPNLLKQAPTPMRILTPEALSKLQTKYQDMIDRMMKSLDKEAHFVPYAPPSFIGFRQSAYLQLSINTTLDAPAGSSRYKLAALAFDDHISHLIRPLLEFFPGDVDFDGIDFSSVLHVKTEEGKPESVEFFFPVRVMRCFASYDCTGQQLIDAGTVLINGERSELNLQVAEGKN